VLSRSDFAGDGTRLQNFKHGEHQGGVRVGHTRACRQRSRAFSQNKAGFFRSVIRLPHPEIILVIRSDRHIPSRHSARWKRCCRWLVRQSCNLRLEPGRQPQRVWTWRFESCSFSGFRFSGWSTVLDDGHTRELRCTKHDHEMHASAARVQPKRTQGFSTLSIFDTRWSGPDRRSIRPSCTEIRTLADVYGAVLAFCQLLLLSLFLLTRHTNVNQCARNML
jgi:hypothetical protein